jgi:hypothetical protein
MFLLLLASYFVASTDYFSLAGKIFKRARYDSDIVPLNTAGRYPEDNISRSCENRPKYDKIRFSPITIPSST